MLEHGGDIKGFQEEYGTRPLDFSANIAPCGVPEKVREAVCAAVDDAINYPDPLCRSLVRALAAHEQVSEHAVLCGNGSSDLLFRLVLALKPKRALLCAPTFAEYEQALATVGATLNFYTLSARNGFTLGADFLEHITPATNLVVLCQPNNPTGVILPPELLHATLQKCEEVGATLLIDECFVGFLDEAPGISVVPWGERAPLPCGVKGVYQAVRHSRYTLGLCVVFKRQALRSHARGGATLERFQCGAGSRRCRP